MVYDNGKIKFEKRPKKGIKKGPSNESDRPVLKKAKKDDKFHFCKKGEHIQKDCLKHKAWFKKKDKPLAFGFLTTWTTNPNEDYLYMGNRVKAPIQAIGTIRSVLNSSFFLDLEQTLYVPSVSRNLIALSKLDKEGFSFKIGSGCFILYKNNDSVGWEFWSMAYIKLILILPFLNLFLLPCILMLV